jgi:hypothetical protein
LLPFVGNNTWQQDIVSWLDVMSHEPLSAAGRFDFFERQRKEVVAFNELCVAAIVANFGSRSFMELKLRVIE